MVAETCTFAALTTAKATAQKHVQKQKKISKEFKSKKE
jgi:hypothetical protein